MSSVFSHHLDLRKRLLARAEDGAAYREIVREIVGLRAGDIVSTAEHLAPFNVADSVSFVLPQMAIATIRPVAELRAIRILGGALVPLDNRQYPRGFFRPGDVVSRKRHNLFPQALRKASSLLLPPVSLGDHPDLEALFEEHGYLRPCFAGSEVQTYAHQMASVMEAIARSWRIGDDDARLDLRVTPLESAAARMLVALIEIGDRALWRLLFEPEVRARLRAGLHGVLCAWGDDHGSFLFWGVEGRRLVRLEERGGALEGGSLRIALTPEDIGCSLRCGRIWPGVYLSLLALSYLPNLAVSGGRKQDHYYRRMIVVTNAVLGLERPQDLSLVGYMTIDPCMFPAKDPVAGSAFGDAKTGGEGGSLRPFGTGLDLARRGLNLPAAVKIMRSTAIARDIGATIPDYS
ncbi:hypothetical protein [Breoghania sp. JC706]|uniref:hypothetical protein n=1 Tax=Breoghania sp. JC706 TaxID=3117732 RepID=UPI00300B6C36